MVILMTRTGDESELLEWVPVARICQIHVRRTCLRCLALLTRQIREPRSYASTVGQWEVLAGKEMCRSRVSTKIFDRFLGSRFQSEQEDTHLLRT